MAVRGLILITRLICGISGFFAVGFIAIELAHSFIVITGIVAVESDLPMDAGVVPPAGYSAARAMIVGIWLALAVFAKRRLERQGKFAAPVVAAIVAVIAFPFAIRWIVKMLNQWLL
jgi:hypothetical protein